MGATWILRSDSSDSLPLPPHVSFLDTLQGLGPTDPHDIMDYRFCVLEHGEGHIQCAVTGSDFAVECCDYCPDGPDTHYAFYRLGAPDGQPDEPPFAKRLHSRSYYMLTAEETAQLFTAYYAGEPWPDGIGMEDISHTYR